MLAALLHLLFSFVSTVVYFTGVLAIGMGLGLLIKEFPKIMERLMK
jgi:uncharacterized membrane protein